MTNVKKTIAAILLTLLMVGVIDLAMKAEEEGACSTASAEWCGKLYLNRLSEAHQELLNCQVQFPQGHHANHDEGCMHGLCDEYRDAFTQWVRPANSYLNRTSVQRVQRNLWVGWIVSEGYHTTTDEEIKSLLANTVGGNQTDWPLNSEVVVQMGY